MISYEPVKSSFFYANKNYCESIENKLKTLNLECSGFCNAYGYEVTTNFDKNGHLFQLIFLKHQSTQNPPIGIQDSIVYAGVEMFVHGLSKRLSVNVGKSLFRRFFCVAEIKKAIPKPYFMKFRHSVDKNFIDNFSKSILNHQISKLSVINGKLSCVIHTPTLDPIPLINEIMRIITSMH